MAKPKGVPAPPVKTKINSKPSSKGTPQNVQRRKPQ